MADKDVNFNNLPRDDYEMIKSHALKLYVDGHISPYNSSVYLAQCYTTAILQFINGSGYKIVKKESKDEQ